MKLTTEKVYDLDALDITLTMDMVSDSAISIRAEKLIEEGMSEHDAIMIAVEEEDEDFRCARSRIGVGSLFIIPGIDVHEDYSYEVTGEFFTDDHEIELCKLLDEAIEAAKEEDAYQAAYEREYDYSWYNR